MGVIEEVDRVVPLYDKEEILVRRVVERQKCLNTLKYSPWTLPVHTGRFQYGSRISQRPI